MHQRGADFNYTWAESSAPLSDRQNYPPGTGGGGVVGADGQLGDFFEGADSRGGKGPLGAGSQVGAGHFLGLVGLGGDLRLQMGIFIARQVVRVLPEMAMQ